MIDKQCRTCKNYNTPLHVEPCASCSLFAGDPPLDHWTPRAAKRDRVGEKLRGAQRKGQPYIRRKEAKQEVKI
ncbi:MAG TPA: hypothetical protein VMX15_06760 [Candidatus Heimdallarchaeota archaeon]|nr:hypothetical protein [Candidatus Heimdallarchaeota archaeon]